MMTTAQVKTYRAQLLLLLSRCDQALTELRAEALRPEDGEAAGSLSNVPRHAADLGSHAGEEDVSLSLVRSNERMIADINAALARLEQGVFGRCEECRRRIAKNRLQALPYARCCIACARKLEEHAGTASLDR
jgi:DnaK suppressor protein